MPKAIENRALRQDNIRITKLVVQSKYRRCIAYMTILKAKMIITIFHLSKRFGNSIFCEKHASMVILSSILNGTYGKKLNDYVLIQPRQFNTMYHTLNRLKSLLCDGTALSNHVIYFGVQFHKYNFSLR